MTERSLFAGKTAREGSEPTFQNVLNRAGWHFATATALACLAGPLQAEGLLDHQKVQKPNVLIILADDLGYGDVQCYNPARGKIATPNIDRLAAQGMRFTDAHTSSAVCSPSRYTLLTGRYHWRTTLQSGIVEVFGKRLIAPGRLTLAGLAREAGYRTGCIGKWHLGWEWNIPADQRKYFPKIVGRGEESEELRATPEQLAAWRKLFSAPIAGGPTACGFDTYFGTDVPNWPPFCFIENDRTLGMPDRFLPMACFRNALASLNGPALANWKLEEVLPELAERASNFVEGAAKSTKPFLLYLPLTAPHTPIAVTPEWQQKSGLNSYADFVMETDAMVGRVLSSLEKSGAAGNTLVIFTSDNGCAPIAGTEFLETQGHFPSGPFRGYKGDGWEGGHRVPFIVRWPGQVKPGSSSAQLVEQADILATIAEIVGIKLAENSGEDSFSFLSVLRGEERAVRPNAVSCAITGVPTLRQGDWKLIVASAAGNLSKERDDNTVKLFNLKDDPAERNNLAATEPGRVAAMMAILEEIIANGRSSPGKVVPNDAEVRRFGSAGSSPAGAIKKKN